MLKNKPKKVSIPFCHYLVNSQKKIHGWYNWPVRECTSERILLNPYNGCSVGCFYCYSRSFPGYFSDWHRNGNIYVFKDFDKVVAKQLDSIDYAFCGYLSPVTDPFQKLENIYHLSEKIIRCFLDRNIPIEFITKNKVPEKVLKYISGHKHCFGQISIVTCKSTILKKLAPMGADIETLFSNIKRMKKYGIFTVVRIDPILPFINDNRKGLSFIIKKSKDLGAKHIVVSVLDIPYKIKSFVLNSINRHFGADIAKKYLKLYKEKIGYLHADINYRKDIFSYLREECDKVGLTFSLCMEYEQINQRVLGLNRIFSSSLNCEGIDIPLYHRKGNKFYPLDKCKGRCLNCSQVYCNNDRFSSAGALKLSDYRKS